MSRWLSDPTAYRPPFRWLGIVAIAIMLGIFVIGLWMSAHHTSLVSQASGDWRGPGVTLTILPEVKGYETASGTVANETGDLVAEGVIDGRSVSSHVAVPRFPPWESTLVITVGGRTWILRVQDRGGKLVLVGGGGRSVTLVRAL